MLFHIRDIQRIYMQALYPKILPTELVTCRHHKQMYLYQPIHYKS